MKLVFYPLLFSIWLALVSVVNGATLEYQNQNHSLVLWNQVKLNEWTDLDIWKNQLEIKESHPDWERVLRENRLKEAVARVLHCVGTCRVETGEGISTASHRSIIYEEEDIVTGKDSYLWLYVLNGGMIRLSPESSVSLKEINIGVKENFVHFRVNYGNVLWFNRFEYDLVDSNQRETDVLFIPVDLYEANLQTKVIPVDENNLFGYLEEAITPRKRYVELNNLIRENNKITNHKPTRIMISTDNVTVSGIDKTIEIVSLVGGSTYVHNRNFIEQGYITNDEFDANLNVDFRGFNNTQSTKVDFSEWVEIPHNGRISQTPSDADLYNLHISEFPSRRIPTLLIAREMWLKKYSTHFFDSSIDPLYLAKRYGYRLWSDKEIKLREKFLRIYIRRLETTNLLNTNHAIEQFKAANEVIKGSDFTSAFYSRAIAKYRKIGDSAPDYLFGEQELNSTRRLLWKKMHARKE